MTNEILELTNRLIKIPSTKDNKKELEDVLTITEKTLTGINKTGYEKDGIKSVIFYNTDNIPSRFKVILNAHLDVVPAKANQYSPLVKGGRLYGRGADDMKAAAAAEILVFKELSGKLKYPLGLQIVTDEEIGGFNGTKLQIDQGIRADFVIAGEQTDLNISNKAKGIIWAKISCSGSSAHGAHLWEGINAIEKMNKFIKEKLYKTFPILKSEAWKTTANLAKIETTNTSFNKVPDDCSISIDFRYIPEEKENIVSKIRRIIPKDFKLEILLNETSQYTDPDNRYLKTLLENIQKVTGKKPKLISDHGASDVRHFDLVKCPGVCFGPTGAGIHTDNEWAEIKSLEQYFEVLKKFLLSL